MFISKSSKYLEMYCSREMAISQTHKICFDDKNFANNLLAQGSKHYYYTYEVMKACFLSFNFPIYNLKCTPVHLFEIKFLN